MCARGKRWISQSNAPDERCFFPGGGGGEKGEHPTLSTEIQKPDFAFLYLTNKPKITGNEESTLGKDSSVGFKNPLIYFPKETPRNALNSQQVSPNLGYRFHNRSHDFALLLSQKTFSFEDESPNEKRSIRLFKYTLIVSLQR